MKKTKAEKYELATKQEAQEIINILSDYYPDAKCSLDYNKDIELVVALILAAQCTDERVNTITPILFSKYPTVYDLAKADIIDIEKIIKPCGFYKNKAKSICETAKIIVDKFNGKVPDNMHDLCTLKGIGRKSSNIILQECFNKTEGIAVDTHVTRISRKLGFSNSNTPEKIENDLKKLINKKYWSLVNHIFVYHGRAICIARRANCDSCPVKEICKRND